MKMRGLGLTTLTAPLDFSSLVGLLFMAIFGGELKPKGILIMGRDGLVKFSLV